METKIVRVETCAQLNGFRNLVEYRTFGRISVAMIFGLWPFRYI